MVLAVYVVTLAPTVTFWDAGEFITAAKTLGIPHPPGSPLFVLVAAVWGRLLPFGAFAWRINLLSAGCGAISAGCWLLVAHDIVGRMHRDIDDSSRRVFAALGGIAAALLGAFTFSTWQNSNETEVYSAATLAVAVVAWLGTRWRSRRLSQPDQHQRSSRLLLLALYVGALSTGIHLMGLLVGPALIAFVVVEARRCPHADAEEQRREWIRIAVIASAWLLAIGLGLGSPAMILAGLVLTACSGVGSRRTRQLEFLSLSLIAVLLGVSTFYFLMLRARQHPGLNAGEPTTWHTLLDVLRRSQYPPRTPFDDPTVPHAPGSPGRTLTLLIYQLGNYGQYFDWQWARSIGEMSRASAVRLGFTLLMATFGIRGAFAQRRADPASFALIGMLFLVTGPGLVLYLNFKPGPSIGWNLWTRLADHEVRDRDYFFVTSFVAWAVWVALGVVEVARHAIPRVAGPLRAAVLGVFAVALVPLLLNARAATRRQTPEAFFARDFALALLESVPPNGILFTWGDNDTFPLWYAQQVEGVRPDVTVICLALTQAPWYLKQIGRQPHTDAVAERLPPIWRGSLLIPVTWAVHGINDAVIDGFRPFRAPRQLTADLGSRGTATIARGATVGPLEIAMFDILNVNAGHRPLAWSTTAADALYGLGPKLVQQGMALVMPLAFPDTSGWVGGAAAGPGGARLDLATTRQLIANFWHFGTLENLGDAQFDSDIQAVADVVTGPMTQVGIALLMRGDTAGGSAMLLRAVRISGDSLANVTLARLRR